MAFPLTEASKTNFFFSFSLGKTEVRIGDARKKSQKCALLLLRVSSLCLLQRNTPVLILYVFLKLAYLVIILSGFSGTI